MTRWWLAGIAALAASAGAGCRTSPPAPARAPGMPAGADRPTPAPAPLPPAIGPGRTIELAPAIGCPRADASLPGMPAPDPAIQAGLLERPWCVDTSEGVTAMIFTADGTLTVEDRGAAGAVRSRGLACWALSADGLLIKRGERWWDEWPVAYAPAGDAGPATFSFRQQRWGRCVAAPPAAPYPPQ